MTGFHDCIGILCVHVFQVIGKISLNMFHIWHWRYYEAYYNDPTHLSQQLVQEQKEQFDCIGKGVHLLSEQYDKIVINSNNSAVANIIENVK